MNSRNCRNYRFFGLKGGYPELQELQELLLGVCQDGYPELWEQNLQHLSNALLQSK